MGDYEQCAPFMNEMKLGDFTINRLFELQTQRTPDATAVIFDDVVLSYAQLDRRANQVAAALIQHGVQPDRGVGLYLDRSMNSVIGMLGILKAGAAYVPLDPSYPLDRLQFMCNDSALSVLATSTELMDQASRLRRPIVLLDRNLPTTSDAQFARHTPRNLAYIIYTSGSTGRPKGVLVEHRNVVGFAFNDSYAPLGTSDCVAHCASPSFDASTWEVWAPLLNGARLLIVRQSTVLDPVALNEELLRHSVTALFLTTGLFYKCVDSLEQSLGGLRYFLTGGDILTPSFVARALAKHSRPKHFLNVYGPTETTTYATTFEITDKNMNEVEESIPIGKPIANTCVYILSEQGTPVPVGEVGEIWIGGACVARGYQNQSTLTEERFVADPFIGHPNFTMYRSGDVGRWRDDGYVEFLGRNDLQVKIRGFRVELGEIEKVLQSFDGVKHAVVLAQEYEPGVKRLIAYIVRDLTNTALEQRSAELTGSEDATAKWVQALRKLAKQRLPAYMIPAFIGVLNELPLTPNGKVDRKCLSNAPVLSQRQEEAAPVGTDTEELLIEVWSNILKMDGLGSDANFFELGGDSLLAIDMIRTVAMQIGIEIPFLSVMQYPTVQGFGLFVDQLIEESKALPET